MRHLLVNFTKQVKRFWVSSLLMALGSAIGVVSTTFTLGSALDARLRTYEIVPSDINRTRSYAIGSESRIRSEDLYAALLGLPGLASLQVDEPFSTGPVGSSSGLATSLWVASEVWHPPILKGRFLAPSDLGDRVTPILVLGSQLAGEWFGNEEPVGQSVALQIAGKPVVFQVVGVLGIKGKLTEWDRRLIVPGTLDKGRMVRAFTVKADTRTSLTDLEARMQAALESKLPGTVIGPPKPLKTDESAHAALRSVELATVLSIMVVVIAGINCGNLATFWSKRRRRELGIRLVVGATKWNVITLVISEVLLLNVAGAFLGILGNLILYRWFGMSLQLAHVAVGVGTGVGVGVMTGLAPALFVSRLDPAEAMRTE